MAIKEILKVNRKTFFNPRAWLSYDTVKEQTLLVWTLVKQIFVTPTAENPETFEEAQARLGLTDEEIATTGQTYLAFALFYALVTVAIFAVAIYFIVDHSFAGFILAVAITVFMGGQAFQNHFLYFQIKHRKLGCTYEEWRHGKTNPKDEGSA